MLLLTHERISGLRMNQMKKGISCIILCLCIGTLINISPVNGQSVPNAGFEAGRDTSEVLPADWLVGAEGVGGITEGFYEIMLDQDIFFEGSSSLRMKQLRQGEYGTLSLPIDAELLEGARLQYRAQVKTDAVDSGYAALWLRIDGDEGMLYMEMMSGRGLVGNQPWTPLEIEVPMLPRATSYVLGAYLVGSGTAWFDNVSIETVPADALPPASIEALSYLDEALEIMQAQSLRRDSIDWPALQAEAHTIALGATDIRGVYPALRYSLKMLGDHHSRLVDAPPSSVYADATEGIAGSQEEGTLGKLPAPRASKDGNLGYVWIPSLPMGTPDQRSAFADSLQALIRSVDASRPCGWIVDLRDNDGGDMWPMLAGIGPILGEGVAGSMKYPDGTDQVWWYRAGGSGWADEPYVQMKGEPYTLHVSNVPVAVLVSGTTASSGEIMMVSFVGRPHSRSFGKASAGLSTGNSSYHLSDGALMLLTTSIYADRTGRMYGKSIQPDVVFDHAAAPAVQEAAKSWLLEQPACR